MKINFLQARNGDCIHIRHISASGDAVNIIIDGGVKDTYGQKKSAKGKDGFGPLKDLIEEIRKAKELVDLLILTHIDDDHIGGLLNWFEHDGKATDLVKSVWFNSGRLIKKYFQDNGSDSEDIFKENDVPLRIQHSTNTGIFGAIKLEDLLVDSGKWTHELIFSGQVHKLEDLELKIIAPSINKLKVLLGKWEQVAPESLTAARASDYENSLATLVSNDIFVEDDAIQNGSSLAFILSFEDKRLLFLGDAHPSDLIDGLSYFEYSKENPIDARLVKLSHHGSKKNTSYALLNLIKSDKFIISTDGSYHKHPDKQLLARLINTFPNCEIGFNYPSLPNEIFSKEDRETYNGFKVMPINDGIEI